MSAIRRAWNRCQYAWESLAPGDQILVLLAISTYLCLGLFFGLFANGFDFSVIYEGCRRVVSGQGSAIYAELLSGHVEKGGLAFVYPAPAAVVLGPLGWLPVQFAWGLFQVLQHAAFWGCWILWRRSWGDSLKLEQRWRAFALFFLFFPIYYSLWLGQGEVFVLFLVLLYLRWSELGKVPGASLALAVAIAMKSFLAILLIHFVLLRHWRSLRWTAAWLALLQGISLLLIPWPIQAAYWRILSHGLGMEAFYDNQSLQGFFLRLLTINRFTLGVAHWPFGAHILYWVTASAIAGFYAVKTLRHGALRSRHYTFGWSLVTGLLISPITETQHFVLLLLLFIPALMDRPRRGIVAAYAFFAIFQPYVEFRYISEPRSLLFATGLPDLVFSLPLFALLFLWWTCSRTLDSMGPEPSSERVFNG